jgi:AraC-like DNA-binding protein
MANSRSKQERQVFSGILRREAIEDMAGAVRQFFDLEAVQLEPGSFRCQIDFVAAGNAFFYREHYPVRTQLTGELLHNRFGFAVPVQGPGLKFSGEEMDHCRLASAMTGEQMDVFAPGGLEQFVVLLDHARLLELADQAGLPADLQRALQPGRATMPLLAKPRAVAAFGRELQRVVREGIAGQLQVDADYLEDWVYGQTLAILDIKEAAPGRPPAAVLVRRAIEVADARGGPVRIAHLCGALRVSPSSLEGAFKSITGVTPHTFFLRRRLTQARSVLLREHPAQRKVTDVATEFGFSELGRFAVRYREMFGETPSQTLKRNERASVSFAL